MRCRWGDTRHTWGRCRHNTVVFQTNLADCTVLRDNVLDSQSSAREAAGKQSSILAGSCHNCTRQIPLSGPVSPLSYPDICAQAYIAFDIASVHSNFSAFPSIPSHFIPTADISTSLLPIHSIHSTAPYLFDLPPPPPTTCLREPT